MNGQQAAVHRTIVVVDVEGFGRRNTTGHQVKVRDVLNSAVRNAFAAADVSWDECHIEDRGDAVFILAPAHITKAPFVEIVPDALVAALTEHNNNHPGEQRIRLRMAVHAGEVVHDKYGVTANAVNLAFRLVDAGPLKTALAGSPGVLALITSEWFYTEVVRNSSVVDPATFRVSRIAEKETTVPAWIALPDHPYKPLTADRTVPAWRALARRLRRPKVVIPALVVSVLVIVAVSVVPGIVDRQGGGSPTTTSSGAAVAPGLPEIDNPDVLKTGYFGPAGAGAIAFSPDSTLLAAGGTPDPIDDPSVRLWSTTSHQRTEILGGGATPLAFSTTGDLLASGTGNDQIQIWDMRKYISTYTVNSSNLDVLTFVPNTDTVVAGSGDGLVQVLDANSGHLVKSSTAPVGVDALAIDAAGQIITAGIHLGVDGIDGARIWNATTGQQVTSFPEADDPLVLSPDARLLVGGAFPDEHGNATGLQIWDVATHQTLLTLTNVQTVGGPTWPIVFSPNGQTLAIGYHDHKIALFRVRTGGTGTTITPIAMLGGYPGTDDLASLAFSPDGRTFAAGTDFDARLVLWDISAIQK